VPPLKVDLTASRQLIQPALRQAGEILAAWSVSPLPVRATAGFRRSTSRAGTVSGTNMTLLTDVALLHPREDILPTGLIINSLVLRIR